MKSSVIIFPGSNCDRDMDVALKKFGFKNQMVWHNDLNLPKSDLIILPGGFSYGDYLRCGSIAAKSKIIKSVVEFANSGGLVVGVCNGFQILIETGLLPGALLRNKYLEFICKNVFVKINSSENKYFKNIKKNILKLHIAHNEGNYFCSSDELKFIEDNNQIAVNYCNKNGDISEENNPNGSINNIAGILNGKKNILGMMPHPERLIDPILSGNDGSILFESLINNKIILNVWLHTPSPFGAEIIAKQGWDSITIDMQHGLITHSDALAILHAISSTNLSAISSSRI